MHGEAKAVTVAAEDAVICYEHSCRFRSARPCHSIHINIGAYAVEDVSATNFDQLEIGWTPRCRKMSMAKSKANSTVEVRKIMKAIEWFVWFLKQCIHMVVIPESCLERNSRKN